MDAELIPRPCPSCLRVMPGTPRARRIELDQDLHFIGRDRARQSPFVWMSCPECFIDYVALGPADDFMRALYADAGETANTMDEKAAATAIELFDQQMSGNHLSIVDLGCGRGLFLHSLKMRGHRVYGVEPNRKLREVSPLAANEIGDATLEIPGGLKVDVLSLQLSFEHLQNPRADLEKWIAKLNPGGYLFLMYHDGNGWAHQLMGEDSPLWDIQHLQILNLDAAEIFCRRLGLQILTDQSYANSYPLAYWARLLGITLKEDSALGRISLRIPAGNRVLVAQR